MKKDSITSITPWKGKTYPGAGADPEYHATTRYLLQTGPNTYLNLYGSPSFGQWSWTIRSKNPAINQFGTGSWDNADDAAQAALKGYILFFAKKLLLEREPKLEDFQYEEDCLRGF